MPPRLLKNHPEAKAFSDVLTSFWDMRIDVIDSEYRALPNELKNSALVESLYRAFVHGNNELLIWTLDNGLDVEKLFSNDYPLSFDLADRLIRRKQEQVDSAFFQVIHIAHQIHGSDLELDGIAVICHDLKSNEKAIDHIDRYIENYQLTFGQDSLKDHHKVDAIIGNLAESSLGVKAIWTLARNPNFAENLRSKQAFRDMLQMVDNRQHGSLISYFEKSVSAILADGFDPKEHAYLLFKWLENPSEGILRAAIQNVIPNFRPFRQATVTYSLLHEVGKLSSPERTREYNSLMTSCLISDPMFVELQGYVDNVFITNGTLWSLLSSAEMIRKGYTITISGNNLDSATVTIRDSIDKLDESDTTLMLDIIRNHIGEDLKKALKRALRADLDDSHFLHSYAKLPESAQLDALFTQCAYEQSLMIAKDGKNFQPSEDLIPLLTAARRLVSNPGGNPHYGFRKSLAFLMTRIDDKFKLDLRPKDKKYARALIMAGHISDPSFFSLLTPKERESKLHTDLGV